MKKKSDVFKFTGYEIDMNKLARKSFIKYCRNKAKENNIPLNNVLMISKILSTDYKDNVEYIMKSLIGIDDIEFFLKCYMEFYNLGRKCKRCGITFLPRNKFEVYCPKCRRKRK